MEIFRCQKKNKKLVKRLVPQPREQTINIRDWNIYKKNKNSQEGLTGIENIDINGQGPGCIFSLLDQDQSIHRKKY